VYGKVFFTTIGLIVLLAGNTVSAASSDRSRSWEATIQVLGTGSESRDGENGSGVELDSATGWGFGLTYNFNEHLAVGFDGAFVKPKYTATFNTDEDGLVSLRHKASVFNGQLNGTWNILKGPFTPYLQLGIGWTHIDSNVADGPPVTGCWWDPWWGYVCSNFYSTYKDTRFSWGGGAGLRYDFQNRMFIKGSINRIEIDAGNNAADINFDLWKLELGWRLN
jgi:opacity protein-like surface antigen